MAGPVDSGQALEHALRLRLGPEAAVGYWPVRDTNHLWPLWPEEAAAMGRAVPDRRAEFAAGRTAARLAMGDVGHMPVAVPMHPDRSPCWPAGMVGSITHHAGHAFAVAAASPRVHAIGIDLTDDVDLPPEAAGEVVFGAEVALPSALVFSAKEATYKAIYPTTQDVWPFDAIKIGAHDGGFTATLRRPAGRFRAGHTFNGVALRHGGLLLTCLVLQQV